MKVSFINEIVNQNFNVVFINALQQFWHTTNNFQCIGAPKKQNLFLFLNGCKITYFDKCGATYVANSGDVVYTPVGSEYKAQLSDFKDTNSCTIGINFLLFDEFSEPFILSDGIQVFHLTENQELSYLFQKILLSEKSQPLIKNRAILMEIINLLAADSALYPVPKPIEKALLYLSEHIEENPSVSELAELCNFSEVYFRKIFKSSVGVSPKEYCNLLRFDKACNYLEYGEISIQEISDMLGFATVSYFIKEFKRRYGCSPLKYRKGLNH